MLGSKTPNSGRKPASIKEAAFGQAAAHKGGGPLGSPRPLWESSMQAGFGPEFAVLLPSIQLYVMKCLHSNSYWALQALEDQVALRKTGNLRPLINDGYLKTWKVSFRKILMGLFPNSLKQRVMCFKYCEKGIGIFNQLEHIPFSKHVEKGPPVVF